MSRRAAATEQTRRRIVEATLELHAEQGIAATRWDQIAERAGVGVGTVYRHFPSLDELVPACGLVSRQILALPEAARAAGLFAGAADAHERMGRLVAEVFAIYERGAPIVRAALRERDVQADVADAADEIETALGALVAAAAEPLDTGPSGQRVMRAMIDIGTWTALREQGIDPDQAVAEVTAMLACHLGRDHGDPLREQRI